MKYTLSKLVKTIKQGNSLYVTIPLPVREVLNIDKGDEFAVTIDGDNVIYTKIKHTGQQS